MKRSLMSAPVCAAALALLLGAEQRASAAFVVITATDAGAGPGQPRPLADAAAASYDAAAGALGTTSLFTFEGLPVGNFTTLAVAPGVSVTLTNSDPSSTPAGIRNEAGSVTLGYNTTAGGSQYLRVSPLLGLQPVSATFNFAQPVNAFGAYFTGVGTASTSTVHLLLNDGTARDVIITGAPTGGATFFGFTDAGASISSLVIQEVPGGNGIDIFGIDDVRYTTAAAVPEPGSITLLGLGVVGLAGYGWRRRKAD